MKLDFNIPSRIQIAAGAIFIAATLGLMACSSSDGKNDYDPNIDPSAMVYIQPSEL